MLTELELKNLYNISLQKGADPKLVLAIGWLETNWGRLGDGKKGMYTGYGSFDSGSDYSYSGFTNQVYGTAGKMAAWGLAPGEVTLEKLQLGNSGVLPTGIYATDTAWPEKVWNIYNQIIEPDFAATFQPLPKSGEKSISSEGNSYGGRGQESFLDTLKKKFSWNESGDNTLYKKITTGFLIAILIIFLGVIIINSLKGVGTIEQ